MLHEFMDIMHKDSVKHMSDLENKPTNKLIIKRELKILDETNY
jgi:hypothetical protein